jgi:hypothetical protein
MIEVTQISVLLELGNSLTAKQERRTFYARRNPIEGGIATVSPVVQFLKTDDRVHCQETDL